MEVLAPYEVIELLLTFTVPQRDIKPLAKKLLKHFGSISAILDASPEELSSFPYIKEKSIALFKFIKQLALLYYKEKTTNIPLSLNFHQWVNYCIEKFGMDKEENFYVYYLDSKFSLIKEVLLTKGIIDRAVVYPRQIMELALKYKSYSILLAHNHPNGNTSPSEDDITLTKALRFTADILGIILYDHIIVSEKGYFSFRKEGII